MVLMIMMMWFMMKIIKPRKHHPLHHVGDEFCAEHEQTSCFDNVEDVLKGEHCDGGGGLEKDRNMKHV